ncbi:MAG TPA: GntR family transcriptional regulator [Crinalium sp.]|jgi:DNA-binding GntR family transcriptional regulator
MKPVSSSQSSKPSQKQSVEDTIYDNICEAIMEYRLTPDTKLGEDSLAEIFQVSRARIRRVLLRLAQDRLVRLEPNRGAFVASPSRQEAKQVFAARRVIESAVVRDAVQVITPAQMAVLEDLAAAEQMACEQGDRHSAIKLSGQFHLQLAEIAGNDILTGFLKDLVAQTSLIIALYQMPGLRVCPEKGHMDLIKAIASGNEITAVDMMLNHLQTVENTLNLGSTLSQPTRLQDILKPRK